MTDKQALKASIKHWTEDYKRLWMFGGEEDFERLFGSSECGLCRQHLDSYRAYTHERTCGRCPLDTPSGDSCDQDSLPYREAHEANYSGDKHAFLRARSNIIRRMKRALARLERNKP